MPEPCLEPDLLRAICSGQLSAPDLARAAQHLGECPHCAAELQQLASKDSLQTASRALHADTTRLWQQVDDILLTASHGETQIAAGPPQFDSPWDWKLPHTLPGYTLLEVLGRGGMGTVYKGRQLALQRTVAIKVPHLAQGSEALQRFLAEAHAVAQLDHPGIVPIYEVVTAVPVQFYAMAFIDGLSLQQRLKNGPLPPSEALHVMRAVCDAVEHAHRQRLIHRDLKPANILLTKDGVPKLTDFGLVRRLDDDAGMTVAGQVLGTPAYMSPEQARGGQMIDARTDVYALGATLFALLTGQPPFVGADTTAVLQQVIHSEARSPRKLQPDLSRDLETICLKCLEKEPDRRYQSAAEVGAELARVIDGRPIQARPVSAPARLARWARRQPLLAGLSAAVALVAIIALGLAAFAARERQQAQADQAAAQEKIKQEQQATQQARAGLDSREQNLTETALQLKATGNYPAARDTFRRQLAATERRVANEKDNIVAWWGHYEALGNLAVVEQILGNLREARDLFRRCTEAIAQAQRLTPADERRPTIEREFNKDLAKTHVNWARCETELGEWAAAEQHFEAAIAIYLRVQNQETVEQLQDDEGLAISELFNARGTMRAQAFKTSRAASDIDAALEDFARAVAVRSAFAFSDETRRLQELTDLEGNRLTTLSQVLSANDSRTAILGDALNEYLQARLQLLRLTPRPEQEADVIQAQLLGLSCALEWPLDLQAWQHEAERGVEALRGLEQRYPTNPSFFSLHAKLLFALARAEALQGKREEAERRYASTFETFGRALALSPASPIVRKEIQLCESVRRNDLKLSPPFAPPPFWVTEPQSLIPARLKQERAIYYALLLAADYPTQAAEFAAEHGLTEPPQ